MAKPKFRYGGYMNATGGGSMASASSSYGGGGVVQATVVVPHLTIIVTEILDRLRQKLKVEKDCLEQ